jgi:hypothetical protein
MLIPARTDLNWFHKYIYADNPRLTNPEVRFIKGRLRFEGTKSNAPFPSMIVIFRGHSHNVPVTITNKHKTLYDY